MFVQSIVCFLVVFLTASEGHGVNPAVQLASGAVEGLWRESPSGKPYASFEGVPYARPPVGKYRFVDPQPLRPWLGVWKAHKPFTMCLQYDPGLNATQGNEDCLYLNVFTPNPSPDASYPVVVYIHGGAFMFGSGQKDHPNTLMNKDLVVVNLNYRLGPLGFLSTEDELISGNFGLKDQTFALKWIQENIAAFGGNPRNVTLTGLSAGGASVHYQFLSPLSKGLFHRGIAFSGAAFAPWTHAAKPLQKAKTLADVVGCPSTDLREMADCLKHRPAEMLVMGQAEMMDWKIKWFTPFRPSTEGAGVRDAFLSQYPFDAAQAGAAHQLPLITSVTSEEGLYPAATYQIDPNTLQELDDQWDRLASNIFEYDDTLPESRRLEVAQRIKQQYLGGRPVSQETFAELVQALGDRLFGVDVGKLAQIHAAKSGQPTYLYRFSFRGNGSLSNLLAHNNEDYGVSHADDVLHFLKAPIPFDTPEDKQMTEDLSNLVYSFAATGVPKLNDQVTWTPVTPGAEDVNYLEIASPANIQMKSTSDFGHKKFWDSLGFEENELKHKQM